MSVTLSKPVARRVANATLAYERWRESGRIKRPRRRARGLPWSDYVWVAGNRVTISGTKARYIWVYYTTSPVTAEWKDVASANIMPDGVEIYDTHVQEIHIPRLG